MADGGGRTVQEQAEPKLGVTCIDLDTGKPECGRIHASVREAAFCLLLSSPDLDDKNLDFAIGARVLGPDGNEVVVHRPGSLFRECVADPILGQRVFGTDAAEYRALRANLPEDVVARIEAACGVPASCLLTYTCVDPSRGESACGMLHASVREAAVCGRARESLGAVIDDETFRVAHQAPNRIKWDPCAKVPEMAVYADDELTADGESPAQELTRLARKIDPDELRRIEANARGLHASVRPPVAAPAAPRKPRKPAASKSRRTSRAA